jgi:hypothetical protein
MAVNVPQTVQDIFAEIQKIRGQPVGGPPVRAGAEELAEIMRPAPEQATVGGIADAIFVAWGTGAVRQLEIISGDNQQGFNGQAATTGLVVRVINKQKTGVEKVPVRFAVSGGGGSIAAGKSTQVTDKNGRATLAAGDWTLGAKGDNTMKVIAGNSAVVFTARAVTSVKPTTATDQVATKNTAVPENPAVRVSDHAGRALAGVNVSFAVNGGGTVGGGGAGAPVVVATDANGNASAGQWLLGPAVGANSVVASAGPFSVTFKAQGT